MGRVDQHLRSIGIELPDVSAPLANYASVVLHAGTATVSGQLSRGAHGLVTGRVGEHLSVEAGREAARLCAINLLATLRAALDLDRVERCLLLSGFVNAPQDFADQSTVINGASDFLVEALGEAGRHARTAVGVSSLPFNAAVEVAASFAIR
ncbi:RidA family protein [Phenylobacterium sp.]|uniref:RidA family protein n=1 Tax=Phenylobacterium sp. TaxID=1871053 RepID=UPI002FCC2FBB